MNNEIEHGPPNHVVAEWIKQCNCCPNCNQKIPCYGVQVGGLCDGFCDCEDKLGEPPFCARCVGKCECEDYYGDLL